MKVIGVTGGIGSGKSTVSRILADLGAKILDADRIAREVVRKGEEGLKELVGCFGPEILDDKGELNRKKLADMTFGFPEKVETLNRITHKYVIARLAAAVEKYRSEGKTEIVVVDVPIPVKEGFQDLSDEIWVVVSEKETRIKRVMDRSSLSREDVEKRIVAQGRDETYKSIADEIIQNDGTLEDLEKKVAKLYVRTKSRDKT